MGDGKTWMLRTYEISCKTCDITSTYASKRATRKSAEDYFYGEEGWAKLSKNLWCCPSCVAKQHYQVFDK